MLGCQIAIQEYRGNMTILYKEGKSHINADGLSRGPLDNLKSNPAYELEVASKILIYFMEIDKRRNFRFYEWAPESSSPDTHLSGPEGTETLILGIGSFELHTEFFHSVMKIYAPHKQDGILLQLLQQKRQEPRTGILVQGALVEGLSGK
ncbi:hypothetical protein O181_028035 [Austropuccinia psidii MF-1]|uniref:Uncharacterized protein n=1 Tax=Austropuccinia psidii MF-1 TaxID=1389203 RepID=A0A9Q3H3S8_9BASI|nr:hypothetical protein [Austropuccinia psidii MF-1]